MNPIPGGWELIIIIGALILFFGKDKVIEWYRDVKEVQKEAEEPVSTGNSEN